VVGVDDSDGVYFVLHYIPDMHWCHLVPMRPEGVFPPRLKWVPLRADGGDGVEAADWNLAVSL
jgi:hypothetical protein